MFVQKLFISNLHEKRSLTYKGGGVILAGQVFLGHNSVNFSLLIFVLVCEHILAQKYKNWKKSKEDEGIRNVLLASLKVIEETGNL